jgi:hypothetical protein
MARISIHRGLAELKIINDRIEKNIRETKAVGIAQKSKLVDGKYDETVFAKNANENYQSVMDLLNRKNSIKTAIVLSNSKTPVVIGNKTMTVADAITMKSAITYKQMLVDQLRATLRRAQSDLEKQNNEIDRRKDELIKATFGKDNIKTKVDEVDAMAKAFDDTNRYILIDPIKTEEKIATLETEIGDFLTDVDAVLSETNATTFIEV